MRRDGSTTVVYAALGDNLAIAVAARGPTGHFEQASSRALDVVVPNAALRS